METFKLHRLLGVIVFLCMCPAIVAARDMPPIVSTEWLEKNISNPKLIILDIRKTEEYRKGHIPGAVSAYYGEWAYSREGKQMEIPYEDDLFDAMGDVGIRPDSLVAVVCNMVDCYYQVQAARVVCTLKYGGLDNVGILDGGYEKWEGEKRPISIEIFKARKTVYKGKLDKDLLADNDYVKSRLGKAVFVDVREPVLYSGQKKQAFIQKAGHIPGSVNLPASEAFARSGAFKTKDELEAIAQKVVGTSKSREIITYCDAGKCCPTWTFIFREVLGYTNVKLYDGGFEEWSKDPAMPVTR